MTGLQDTQRICKAQPIEECLRHIQRHAIDLADGGPSNLLQIAQQNIPARPATGQAIGLPIENVATEGVTLIITVYRAIFEHAPRRPEFDMGWDPIVLAKSAAAIAIAAHAAMFVGDSLLDIYVPKEKILTDFKEDRLVCQKDMLCITEECCGQEENNSFKGEIAPYCKKVC
jgi:hypothetical protein